MSSGNSRAATVGLTLVVTGGMVGVCGLGMAGAGIVRTVRRWANAQAEPAKVIAAPKIAKAPKTAAAAGTRRDEPTTTRPVPV